MKIRSIKLQRVPWVCKCCGEKFSMLATVHVFDAISWCDNCNRPVRNILDPCDHKPWRRRLHTMERRRARMDAWVASKGIGL